MQSVNFAQILDGTCIFLSSACIPATQAPFPVIVIGSFTSMYTSLLSRRLDFSIEVLNLIWLCVM